MWHECWCVPDSQLAAGYVVVLSVHMMHAHTCMHCVCIVLYLLYK